MKAEDRERVRELATLKVLWELLAAKKNKVDVVTWRYEGGPEAEAFLHALDTGGQHPLLEKWQELRRTVAAHRPVPDPLDLIARRHVVSMVKALHRTGLSKSAARKRATQALKQVFPATTEQIRYWQANHSITVDDEKRIAKAIKQYGNDHRQIVGWFVALIHFAIDPAAARAARLILIES